MAGVILIVEDDHGIARNLSRALVSAGYTAFISGDLHSAREAYVKHRPNLLVLDLLLPDGNGLDMLTDLRAANDRVPAIITSGLCGVEHQLAGFDAGVNDYVPKPYEPSIMVAKVGVWLEARTPRARCTLVFDPETRTLSNGRQCVVLTPTESWIMLALADHPDTSQKRQLLVARWPLSGDRPKDRTLDHHIFHLRGKLNTIGVEHGIHTDRHAYKWNGEVQVVRHAGS